MKKLVLLFLVFSLTTCTLEKRQYRSGYHVEWHGLKKSRHVQNNIQHASRPVKPEPVAVKPVPSHIPVPPPATAEHPATEARATVNNPSSYTNVPSASVRAKMQEIRSGQADEVPAKSNPDKPLHKSGTAALALVTAAVGVLTFGIVRSRRKSTMKVTRWAKAHPLSTQGLITGLFASLLGLSFYTGHNIAELGYSISSNLSYCMAALMALGFVSIPFFPKNKDVVLPHELNRNRLAYIGITLSALTMAIGTGNRYEMNHGASPLVSVLQSVDMAVLGAMPADRVDLKQEFAPKNSADDLQSKRMAAATMSAGGAIVLTFLLVLLFCSGVCLIIGGFSLIADGAAGGILAILGGVLLIWLALRGFKSVHDARKASPPPPAK